MVLYKLSLRVCSTWLKSRIPSTWQYNAVYEVSIPTEDMDMMKVIMISLILFIIFYYPYERNRDTSNNMYASFIDYHIMS